ncbi:MAG: hypothetical protein U0414_14990 [Polyangiaceae bacterium]
MAFSRALFLLGSLLTIAACNADTSDVFGNSEGTTNATGSPSGSTSGSGTSSGAGGMGGAPAQTGATTGATMQTSTTGQGPSSSAATTGSGMTTTDVTCGNQACQPNQVCCYSNIAPTDHCAMKGTCGIDAQLECNGPDDCPGAKCCGKKNGGNWQYTHCAPNCEGGEIFMCAEAPNSCGPQKSCQPIEELGQGWFGCFGG